MNKTFGFTDKVAILLLVHFGPDVGNLDYLLTCEDCKDYKNGFCSGESREGEEVVMCMEHKARRGAVYCSFE